VRLRRVLAVTPVIGLLGGVPVVQGADTLSVYPTAGTQTASPTTQISFRGAATAPAASVLVSGSATGPHSGTVENHSDGNGFSFIPDQSFQPGETVSVQVMGYDLVGEQNGSVSFQIYTPVPHLKLVPNPDAGGTAKKSQHFHSEPHLLPPFLVVMTKKGGTAPGDLFTAPKISRGQDGAMITNKRGQLIWFHPAPKGTSIYDFRVQHLGGQPVLTWWQGKTLFAKGYGKGVIYDTTYRKIGQVTGANGYKPDLHEFELGPDGTAYTTNYQPVMYDVSSITGTPGQMGKLFDCVIQGIDIKTGLVKFEWHSLDHIPLTDSYFRFIASAVDPFDPVHLNSVEPEPNGNLLLSGRNTSAAYEIDPSSGNILWRLGGKSSDFSMGPRASFVAQHDVRRRPDGDITVFDNGTPPQSPSQKPRPARGIQLHLDMNAHTATLVHKFKRRQKTFAASQGNVETLPNGNVFVGWGGSSPYMSEFKSDGSLVFDARFDPGGSTIGTDTNSYRAYKLPWSARPYFPPKLALESVGGGKLEVYLSWNGATDVAKWEVLAGSSPSTLKSVKRFHHNGFESSTRIPSSYKYVAARARASDGSVLGTTQTVKR